MSNGEEPDRRRFLVRTGAVCAGAISVLSFATPALALPEEKDAEEISPVEDLMREHGALNRLLLIYDEGRRRLETKSDLDITVLGSAADIIRRFVEEYHEKLEEDFLFPRFQKAGKLVDLVNTLLQQHRAGRRVTGEIQALAVSATLKDEAQTRKLSAALRSFLRMYRPHEAPGGHSAVSGIPWARVSS